MCRSEPAAVKQVAQDPKKDVKESVTVFSLRSETNETGYNSSQVNVQDVELDLLIDLGAKVSIINESTFKEHLSSQKLDSPSQRLVCYNNEEIEVLGVVRLSVQYQEQRVESFPFYVTSRGTSLMGIDLFNRLGFQVTHNAVPVQSVELASRFPEAFREFGKVIGYNHRPNVDTTVKPVSQKLRRLPLTLRDEVSKELRRLEEIDVIEKIDSSPWISNLVVARRPSGEIRLCVDLREVNKAIIPDKYPLPSQEELMTEFCGSTIFSKLDLRKSYLQIPLHKDSKHLTAFITHDGVFQYKRMLYGLSSAPSAFQKFLSSILSGVKGAFNIIDDIIVHGKDSEQHDERLNEVLSLLNEHHLSLNTGKCVFSATEVDFFGYSVSAVGVRPLESNVKTILDLPEPKNTKELASFLGTTNFYLKFVSNYAQLADPLRLLLRKDVPWVWTEAQSAVFATLKQKIASPPILAHFNSDAPTVVSADASGVALGAVLSQLIDGQEYPVSFASKTLSETERRYSAGEREALACIFACEHWHNFLFGRKFLLRTDHVALQALLSRSGSGHKPVRLYRWAERLHQYNFEVQYIPGSTNYVADMLSRLVVAKPSAEDWLDSDLGCILEVNLSSLVTPNELLEASRGDLVLQQVAEYIKNGWPKKVPKEFTPYFQLRSELAIFNQCCIARGTCAVIPESLRARVLCMAHDGHPGIVRMKQRCREAVWWPKMNTHVEQLVLACEACARNGKSVKPVQPPLQPIPWPARPWQHLQIDIAGEFVAAPQSHKYMIVVHDLHSKWSEVSCTSSVTSGTVIKTLQGLFIRWGLPEAVTTDNGPQFTSFEFTEFLSCQGIEHRVTSLYNPQSNGGVERFNRTMKEGDQGIHGRREIVR